MAFDLRFTADRADLEGCTFFIVTVPTPIDGNRQPDLGPVRRACETVGRALTPGAVVVFESTVYPGVTEEVCGPLLAAGLGPAPAGATSSSATRPSGSTRATGSTGSRPSPRSSPARTRERCARVEARLRAGGDGGPAPGALDQGRRGRQGDREHAARPQHRADERARDHLRPAGHPHQGRAGRRRHQVELPALHARAWSAATASASTPTTSPPRPRASATTPRSSWPAGGSMTAWAPSSPSKLVKLLVQNDVPVKRARVGVLGLTFKEDVPDLRNSRVPDILRELKEFGIEAMVHDPLADPEEARAEYGIALAPLELFHALDAVVLAVPHASYREAFAEGRLSGLLTPDRHPDRREIGAVAGDAAGRGPALLESLKRCASPMPVLCSSPVPRASSAITWRERLLRRRLPGRRPRQPERLLRRAPQGGAAGAAARPRRASASPGSTSPTASGMAGAVRGERPDRA